MDLLHLVTASVGSPECALISAGAALLAGQYRLPSYIVGAWGDSKLGEARTGDEKTLTDLMAASAGTNLIYGLGMIESGVTFDLAQLVIDDEIARMIKQMIGGIQVSIEHLAVQDIAGVGSFGDFLSLDATMAHMRE